MIKNSIITLVILMFISSCKGQGKEQNMEKVTEEIIKLVHSYSETPVYSLQMNKQGCKLVVEMENNVDYRLAENNGESIMIPLNPMITKSGKQILKIKIYPKDNEQFLTKYAHVQINIFNAPNKKSSLKEYMKVSEFTLPQGLEAKKITYYEHKIEFDAHVPFDYSKELDESQDLSKISNLEEKITKKYNEVKSICEKSEIIAYNQLSIHSSALVYNTTYTSIEEIKNSQQNNRFGIVESNLKNRKFLPIENYIIQYYANNKIVALWQKNHNPQLHMTGENSSGKT